VTDHIKERIYSPRNILHQKVKQFISVVVNNQRQDHFAMELTPHCEGNWVKTYPIAIELTAWVELGVHQYNLTIDDKSTVSIKRSDDVLHSRDLNPVEVSSLIEAISRVEIPLLEYVSTDSTIPSPSYELIIE